MALPSFLKRLSSPSPATAADALADETAAVQQARLRARRRLVGAVVLLAIGVVVFPLVFETQPRPLAGDIPIELPRRDATAPRNTPVAPRAGAVVETPVAEAPPAPVAEAAPAAAVAEAPRPADKAVDPPAEKAPEKPAEKVVEKPAEKVIDKPADKPVATDAARQADSERARALLEGRTAASGVTAAAASDARSGRFVVQVGAYTDPATLRDVRAKVEKLGLKTYTQSVDTEAGRRTRVRVGPFATRQEADSASDRLKAAGLPGNVLVL